MKYAKTLGSIALAALLVSGFSGCSDGGSDAVTGYYLDSAVENVDYTTADGGTFQTGADGSFTCKSGTSVTFKIGNLVLRTISDVADGQKVIENDPAVITLLQSIDANGNPDDGIQITEEVKTAVVAWLDGATSIDNNDSNEGKLDNIEALETALAEAGVTGATTVTLAVAEAHVEGTIADELASSTTAGLGTQVIVGDTINYVDYNGEVRKAPLSAAAAEFHTGAGIGKTLFDSADDKCQNCHNELYDTWKGSMHGQSWVDPIFQSKFQDFLRTHLAKIGEHKDSDDNLQTTDDGIRYQEKGLIAGDTKKMFSSGAAPTCIKCHAPGAYYAGDYNVTVVDLNMSATLTNSALLALKALHEKKDPTGKIVVIAANPFANAGAGAIYKATFEITHKANQEGINCAFCHSIETPRMMEGLEDYTLKKDMRSGPHGPLVRAAGLITSEANASSSVMNNFFRLWGPEKPLDYNSTSKATDNPDLRAAGDKGGDGRYGMTNVDLNGINGKTHFTGGPYYGPFGVSGKSNENATDETNRTAHYMSSDYNATSNNHFGSTGDVDANLEGDHGKSLCLSCHQRSAGAKVPGVSDQFMELCSTQMAVTTEPGDNPENDSLSSPKCQKCHMERIQGNLLHKWARPDLSFDATEFETAVGYALTPQLDGKDTTIGDGNNPQRDGWFNSHAFAGGSKTSEHNSDTTKNKESVRAKIASGFYANVERVSNDGSTLKIKTTFRNETAHMFPGAHPMRRVLTRVIVTDGTGAMLTPTSVTGISDFDTIYNGVQPIVDKELHSSALPDVPVEWKGGVLNFPGKADDLNGSIVSSQRFASREDNGTITKPTIPAVDDTVKKTYSVIDGNTTGKVFNSAITESDASEKFTRIYGHQTGKWYPVDGVSTFIVRPGFDSNKVVKDTRLSPNETEIYSLDYNVTGRTGVTAKYVVYYMQKGANGQFVEDTNASSDNYGWLNQSASDAAGYLVTPITTTTATAE